MAVSILPKIPSNPSSSASQQDLPAKNQETYNPRFTYLDLDITKTIYRWSDPLFEKDPMPYQILARIVCLVALPIIAFICSIEMIVDVIALPLTWIGNQAYYYAYGNTADPQEVLKIPVKTPFNSPLNRVLALAYKLTPLPAARLDPLCEKVNTFGFVRKIRGMDPIPQTANKVKTK